MAQDLAGLIATLALANANMLKSAALTNNDAAYIVWQTWQAEVKKAATANGGTVF